MRVGVDAAGHAEEQRVPLLAVVTEDLGRIRARARVRDRLGLGLGPGPGLGLGLGWGEGLRGQPEGDARHLREPLVGRVAGVPATGGGGGCNRRWRGLQP